MNIGELEDLLIKVLAFGTVNERITSIEAITIFEIFKLGKPGFIEKYNLIFDDSYKRSAEINASVERIKKGIEDLKPKQKDPDLDDIEEIG